MNGTRDFFGGNATLHHVGIAVRSIVRAFPDCAAVNDPGQGVDVGFMDVNGVTLELVEPAREGSPVSSTLDGGGKLLHLCYEVDVLEDALVQARKNGFHVVRDPVAATAFEGRRIAFVYHRTLGLFELLERSLSGDAP